MPQEIIDLNSAIFGAGLGIALGIILVFTIGIWVLNIVALMVGAKLAGIKDRGFGKALMATVLIVFLGGFIVAMLTMLHPLAGLLGFFLVPCLFVKWVYSCSLGRAVLAYVLSFFASITFFIAAIFIIPVTINIIAGPKPANSSDGGARTENPAQPGSTAP